ncbi:MAG: ABC transporter ATP-binding protein [Hyphomonadaceae bacterium]
MSLLSLSAVSVSLQGAPVLHGVSLDVTGGEIVALLGPNGAGKTTLMRAALAMIALSGGDARLGDAAAHALSPRARALRAAYLPQRPSVAWPVRVEELTALGRYAYGAAPDRLSAADRAAVDAALQACGLTALRARRMDEISGGEAARAHLARALAQQAPLLLLDEPTAGLDPAQALGVAEILRRHAASGGGALMSTHDVALAARVADRVALLHGGRVLAQGAAAQVLKPELLQQAYGRAGRLLRDGESFAAVFD